MPTTSSLSTTAPSIPQLTALNPLDGRYQSQITELQKTCNEMALLRLRVFIEIEWLKTIITATKTEKQEAALPKKYQQFLDSIAKNFSEEDALRIKALEAETNHDIKAVEYFIKEKIDAEAKNHKEKELKEFSQYKELVHIGCTSDDINNLAYALMIKEARDKYLLPALAKIIGNLRDFAHAHAHNAMLSRTHGQPATPTTIGKEFANFAFRLQDQYNHLANAPIKGKFNSTTGNYNALCIAYPEHNWQTICKNFVTNLGIAFNPYTTQIEPHDYIVDLCHTLAHINNILLDLCRDVWGYISLDYFTLKASQKEVGSSAMPHKINPITFENAEGNLGIANALFYHFAAKLPISRWQRDLSDSTVLRNLGSSFAYSLLAYKMLQQGLAKLKVNHRLLETELEQHWEILAEAIQTVMRRYNIANPYEKLKTLTRGQKVEAKNLHDFINHLEIPQDVKRKLLALLPQNYLGKAVELAKNI